MLIEEKSTYLVNDWSLVENQERLCFDGGGPRVGEKERFSRDEQGKA